MWSVFAGGRELHSDCLALVQAPTVQVEPQLTLPLDINNYPLSKLIQVNFRVSYKLSLLNNVHEIFYWVKM